MYSGMVYSRHSNSYQVVHPVGIEYLVRLERSRSDHSHKVPNKHMVKENLPWGYFGWTYVGHNKMYINERLDETPELKAETMIHEAIHTDDEYETRILSREIIKEESRKSIMKRLFPSYNVSYSQGSKKFK